MVQCDNLWTDCTAQPGSTERDASSEEFCDTSFSQPEQLAQSQNGHYKIVNGRPKKAWRCQNKLKEDLKRMGNWAYSMANSHL